MKANWLANQITCEHVRIAIVAVCLFSLVNKGMTTSRVSSRMLTLTWVHVWPETHHRKSGCFIYTQACEHTSKVEIVMGVCVRERVCAVVVVEGAGFQSVQFLPSIDASAQ